MVTRKDILIAAAITGIFLLIGYVGITKPTQSVLVPQDTRSALVFSRGVFGSGHAGAMNGWLMLFFIANGLHAIYRKSRNMFFFSAVISFGYPILVIAAISFLPRVAFYHRSYAIIIPMWYAVASGCLIQGGSLRGLSQGTSRNNVQRFDDML